MAAKTKKTKEVVEDVIDEVTVNTDASITESTVDDSEAPEVSAGNGEVVEPSEHTDEVPEMSGEAYIDANADSAVSWDITYGVRPLPIMREAYWTCAACETDTRKYRDGYHHATFDDGHVGSTARDNPICPECGSTDMTFHVDDQQEDLPVWDIEHQCWRTPNGMVYRMELDANVIACPYCSSAAGISANNSTKYECTHCNILINP